MKINFIKQFVFIDGTGTSTYPLGGKINVTPEVALAAAKDEATDTVEAIALLGTKASKRKVAKALDQYTKPELLEYIKNAGDGSSQEKITELTGDVSAAKQRLKTQEDTITSLTDDVTTQTERVDTANQAIIAAADDKKKLIDFAAQLTELSPKELETGFVDYLAKLNSGE